MSIPNQWEFPGGKVEENESLQEAIEREVQEELNCNIKALDVYHNNTHEYDTFIVNLISLKCKLIEGTPVNEEHSILVWLKKENLDSLKWTPVDIPTVNSLINEI